MNCLKEIYNELRTPTTTVAGYVHLLSNHPECCRTWTLNLRKWLVIACGETLTSHSDQVNQWRKRYQENETKKAALVELLILVIVAVLKFFNEISIRFTTRKNRFNNMQCIVFDNIRRML